MGRGGEKTKPVRLVCHIQQAVPAPWADSRRLGSATSAIPTAAAALWPPQTPCNTPQVKSAVSYLTPGSSCCWVMSSESSSDPPYTLETKGKTNHGRKAGRTRETRPPIRSRKGLLAEEMPLLTSRPPKTWRISSCNIRPALPLFGPCKGGGEREQRRRKKEEE